MFFITNSLIQILLYRYIIFSLYYKNSNLKTPFFFAYTNYSPAYFFIYY